MALYGTSRDGALLEDIASQQKSFVAVLATIAADKGLLVLSPQWVIQSLPVRAPGATWSRCRK